ncbi:hypothetical protein BDV93DRAFT_546949 [Ceratobasidium sp. AG-I]|nr:hypothetical protein BDV93DRAFT_546949 [Ceratobasidium sp. AG-I]
MSRNTESVMSSAVSLSGVESLSDDISTISVENKAGINGSFTNALFNLGDGDLNIIVNGKTLETHKFLIKRFANLKDRILNGLVTLESGEPEVEDFSNTFKILYASVIEGPFDFDQTTLISALLVATKYDYPALRIFAISKLEKAALSAVERIRLARKFNIPSWEEPAFLELCERDEAITVLEAEVLGLKTVVHMGRIREQEQRRRGKEVDAMGELKGSGITQGQAGEPEAMYAPITPAKAASIAPTTIPSKTGSAQMTEVEVTGKDVPSTETLQSSYSYSSFDGKRIMLSVPGCECKVHYSDGSKNICPCKLPPCAVSAFKELQTQQLAHKGNIFVLSRTVEQMQAAMSSLKPTAGHITETEPYSSIRSSSLKEDVQKWLLGGYMRMYVTSYFWVA